MAIGGTDKLTVRESYDHLGRLLAIATATSSHAYTYGYVLRDSPLDGQTAPHGSVDHGVW